MKNFLKKHNILVAPMEGVMRPAVMEVCNALDLADCWMTPFFRVSETVPKVRELKRFLEPFAPEKKPVILQIMGNNAEKLSETARRALEAGARGIDLNCGCPSCQVIRHSAGAASMLEYERTARILEALRKALGENFLSVKTRLGFYETDESEKFLSLWENAGEVDLFTLHFRTANEAYKPIPGRDERLQRARTLLKNALVFGNGDLADIREAEKLCSHARLDGAMIGRNFWHNPLMFKNPDTPPETARRIFWEQLSALPYGEKHWAKGSAIEMAALIFGKDSPEANALKKQFR